MNNENNYALCIMNYELKKAWFLLKCDIFDAEILLFLMENNEKRAFIYKNIFITY